MKKFFSIAALAVFAFGTIACSSDDNSSSSYKSDILGEWKEVKITYLDKDKNVIDEELAKNEDCGPDEVEFKTKEVNFRYSYKDFFTKDCITEIETNIYSISGNTITVELEEEGEKLSIKSQILEISKTKLVIEAKDQFEEFNDGTVYVRSEYSRK
ncbi:lipocalin family protein [Myroides fluvii]|uniref:lipocalin family protein n=1 Tax=Myroides fluvii TaxID=2572594 RepID=UPI00131B07D9|nr:lipocalin family protein [Myroides fluvii]